MYFSDLKNIHVSVNVKALAV